jgi:hypothetical protein
MLYATKILTVEYAKDERKKMRKTRKKLKFICDLGDENEMKVVNLVEFFFRNVQEPIFEAIKT